MTITFVCRSSKVSKKDGLTPLELYVIINGKRRFVSLNRRIDPKLFNPKKQIVRGDDQMNEYIEATYSAYEYTAYPSISNTDPDNWRKFRVIFPLAHTLSIPNDSLSVLKLLRRMVCKYEDKQHNLGAFINQEQWAMRREHDGRLVEIGQDTVVYLDTLIKSLKTYTTKFQKSKDGHFTTTHFWTLERAFAYYGEHDQDGERHQALFVIKNRLSDEDCDLFVDWLKLNHPTKMHHWLSHRRLVRTSA